MKKYLLLILSVIIIVPFFNFGIVYAEEKEEGLLSGKTLCGFSFKNRNGKPDVCSLYTTVLTDNDVSTTIWLGNQLGHRESFVFYFAEPYIITSAYFRYSDTSNLSDLELIFYDKNLNLIKRINLPKEREITFDFEPVENVYWAGFHNKSGTEAYGAEFDLYGYNLLPAPEQVSQIVTRALSNSEIEITWQNPEDDNFAGVDIYVNNQKIVTLDNNRNSYVVNNLQKKTQYEFKIISRGINGINSEPIVFYETTLDIDDVPPKEIKNLKSYVYADRIKFTWENPDDVDFYEVRIYRDGQQIATAVTPANTFTDYDLEEHTVYTFVFYTVDTSGNRSAGVSITEKTKGKPLGHTSIYGSIWNESVEIFILKHPDDTVYAYNIYVNGQIYVTTSNLNYMIEDLQNGHEYEIYVTGVNEYGESAPSNVIKLTPAPIEIPEKVNLVATVYADRVILNWNRVNFAREYRIYKVSEDTSTLLDIVVPKVYASDKLIDTTTNNYYTIENLNPKTDYTFYVIASNELGNSEPAYVTFKTLAPKAEIPKVSVGYDLKEVSDGVTTWFSSIWLIVAFAVSIPLAFYIGNNVKTKFLG